MIRSSYVQLVADGVGALINDDIAQCIAMDCELKLRTILAVCFCTKFFSTSLIGIKLVSYRDDLSKL